MLNINVDGLAELGFVLKRARLASVSNFVFHGIDSGYDKFVRIQGISKNIHEVPGLVLSTFFQGHAFDNSIFSRIFSAQSLDRLLKANVLVDIGQDQSRTNDFVIRYWKDHFFLEHIPAGFPTSNYILDKSKRYNIMPKSDILFSALLDVLDGENQSILDLNPYSGAIPILISQKTNSMVHCITHSSEQEIIIDLNVGFLKTPSVCPITFSKAQEQKWDLVYSLYEHRLGPNTGWVDPHHMGYRTDLDPVEQIRTIKSQCFSKMIFVYECLGNSENIYSLPAQNELAIENAFMTKSYVMDQIPVRKYLESDWIPRMHDMCRFKPLDMITDEANRWVEALPDGEMTQIYTRCDVVENTKNRPGMRIIPMFKSEFSKPIVQYARQLARR